jgi:WD40 repeat protein/tRNA A-37 threonylcarbamoyl transferase component Bud32
MGNLPQTHPSPEQLTAFGLGQASFAESARIESHVLACDCCAQAVKAVPNDHLIAVLQQSAVTLGTETGAETVDAPTVAKGPAEVPAELARHPRYRIVELLGSGGMGAVYKAEHLLMERPVALKVIRQRFIDEPAAVERFRREVKAAARLAHPNIVTAHDADQAGDTHFLVMEYVEGTTLARLVQEQGPLPVDRACDYARQAALGLQHAHERGMVHRDIKPHNLMLTADGQVKILDFGLARFATERSVAAALTEANAVMGTPDYIAPEQANDAHQADIRADIYSLGCTLYHLLTGRPPFPEGTALQKIKCHLDDMPPALNTLRPDVPVELAGLVERMMAKDPSARYRTPGEVAAALVVFVNAVPLPAVVESPPPPAGPGGEGDGDSGGRPPRRRRRLGRLAAAAVLLLALGSAGYVFGPALYRIATDRGELVIESDDPDVEVNIKQGGQLVSIVDLKTKRVLELKAGEYELKLPGEGKNLRLSTDRFTLKRGDQVIVRVSLERAPAPPAQAPAAPDRVRTAPDPATPLEIIEIRRFLGHRQPVNAVAVSPDGRLLLSGSNDKTARLWDLATGKEVRRFEGHPENILTVAFSPDGRRALTAGGGGLRKEGKWQATDFSIRLWDVATGREIRRLLGHTKEVWSATFTPDGRGVLSGSADTTVRLWDAETGQVRQTLRGHEAAVFSVACSRDGRSALSGGADKTMRLWDLETGQEIRRFGGHTGTVRSVLFARDGRWALSGAEDKSVRLWDVASGELTHAFVGGRSRGSTLSPTLGPAATGHQAGVTCAAFAPGDRLLLSAGGVRPTTTGRGTAAATAAPDYRVRLWDPDTGQELGRFEGHDKEVLSVAFLPGDGALAVSAGADKTIRLLWLPQAAPGEASAEKGQLVLDSDGPKVPVLVKRRGAVVTVINPRVNAQADLKPGDYELELVRPPEGLHLSAEKIALKAGAKSVIAIRREPAAGKPASPALTEVRRLEGHTGDVQRVVFSPDGSQALSASTDRTVRLWDVATGALVRTLEGHTEQVLAVAFAPDGSRAASGGGFGHLEQGKLVGDFNIRLWEVATGKEIRQLAGHTNQVWGLAFSPDGKYLVSAGGDFLLRLWDVESGRELRSFEGHEDKVYSVAFSPDGRYLLSGSEDATVRLWDVETGRQVRSFDGHTEAVRNVAFSPDGRLALSAGFDQTMRLWDVATGRQLRAFAGHETGVIAVAFAPDGRRALSTSGARLWSGAGFDYRVRLWDVASGQELARYEGPTSIPLSVAFAPDGRSALCGNTEATLRLLKLPEPPGLPITEVRRFERPPDQVNHVAVAPDGKRAASCYPDGGLHFWDLDTGKPLHHLTLADNFGPWHLAFSPDGGRLLCSGGDVWKEGKWQTFGGFALRLLDATTGKEIRRFAGHTASVRAVAFTPDGRHAVSGSDDTTVRIWDVATGRELHVCQGHDRAVYGVAAAHDNRHAASAGTDGTVRVWDIVTGEQIRQFKAPAPVWCVAFAPDDRQIVSGGDDKALRLWDVQTGRQVREFLGHTKGVFCVAFSPDGRRLLSSSWGTTVRLWDTATGQQLGRFDGHLNFVWTVCFLPDGQSAVTGSGDSLVRLLKLPAPDEGPKPADDQGRLDIHSDAADGWLLVKQGDEVVRVLDAASQTVALPAGAYELELAGRTEGLRLSADKVTLAKGGRQRVEVRRPPTPIPGDITEVRRLRGHRYATDGVALSPDGSQVLSCGTDGARLWDVFTGRELRRLEGTTEAVYCVAFSPDGWLALGGGSGMWKGGQWQRSDYRLFLWDVATGKVLRHFEGHTGLVLCVAFSPDGQHALSGAWDHTVRLWDVATGRQERVFTGHASGPQGVAFSPDGKLALSGAWDRTVLLWDVSTGQVLRRFEGHGAPVRSVAFSPDGRMALTASLDRTVRLWDIDSGRPLQMFEHPTRVIHAAFSPDGRRILSASGMHYRFDGGEDGAGWDHCVRLWDVTTGQEVGHFDGCQNVPTGVAFSSDGRFAVSGCWDKTVRLLALPEDAARRPAAAADQGRLALADDSLPVPVIVWHGQQLATVLRPGPDGDVRLNGGDYELEPAGRPEGLRLSATKVTLRPNERQTVAVRRAPADRPPLFIGEVRRLEGHTTPVPWVTFSPDGKQALSCSWDRFLRLWDVEMGKELRRFEHPEEVWGVAFSPDGRTALAAGGGLWKDGQLTVGDPSIRLWDLATGQEIRRFPGHARGRTWSVAFSPDGKRALSGGDDGTLRLWDVETGAPLRVFEGHESGVKRVAFSPDGRQAVSGSWDATVRLWDVESGKELHRLEGHTEMVECVAFSPDGRQVLSCAEDRTMRLWDATTGRLLRTFDHPTGVLGVAFTPDGRRALSGSGCRPPGPAGCDYRVRLWDLAGGQEVARFEGHTSYLTALAVSPDGRLALSGSDDHTLRLLKLPELPRGPIQINLNGVKPADLAEQLRKLLQEMKAPDSK